MAKARLVELDPDMTFAQAAARTVATRTDELFGHAGGVLDTGEIEHVHDMRVATRRLRAALEVFAPCFPRDVHREVLREVKALADALGRRRDPDVHLEALLGLRKRLPPADHPGVDLLIARARAQQADGNVALREALEEALTRDLRGRLGELAHG
ncbi:MAG: triphosphatase [Solirubrobacteraceae bacterium]|jgi:CHAD domain-containing protein|nr:triphosphatase [Solirubrobacteraceae bacterium]